MRKTGLDLLRAIAVILVLFRHSDLENNVLAHFGWLGVDLFFVLSGFLVAGLLFSEYQKYQTINLKRFLIRRAFKIFPPFYFFVLLTIAFDYSADISYDWGQVGAELLYVQNYTLGIWLHTWSLAVEEHFYLLLVFATAVVLSLRLMTHRNFVVSSLLFLLILSFGLRLHTSYPHRHEDIFYFMRTHLRADGIIMGVLLAYLYHFTTFTQAILQRKRLVVILAVLLIAPGFYFAGGSFFMNVVGLTTVNLGFTLIVLLILDFDKYLMKLGTALCGLIRMLSFVGINSYSIYLWHLNARKITYSYFDFPVEVMTLLYLVLSIVIGVLMSYLVEKNALKVRDALWKKAAVDFQNT